VTTGAVCGLLLILAGSWLSTDGRLPPGLAAVVGRVLPQRRSAGARSSSRAAARSDSRSAAPMPSGGS
jgi:hypothetical protein